MNFSCTSAACWLAQNGKQITFPLVTVAGIVDGINPCAIGMILLLLGYLIIFARLPAGRQASQEILKLGGAYILTVYLTYLAIGLLFYRSVETLNFSPYRIVFDRILGVVLLLAGALNIKDFFAPGKGLSLEIPQRARPQLLQLVEKVSLPTTILLAVLVTLLETPCSLPIYIGTATILNYSGLAPWLVLGYFLYYNFLFVLPLLVILFLVWRSREVMVLKDWEHKAKRWMRLGLGVLLVLMAGWLLI